MTKRLQIICSRIPKSRVFADVGCDHGYCARYVLDHDLAERVYITDVSEKCLIKAKKLMQKEIAEGKCAALVGDGISVLPEMDTVLIAGMGGEEIVKILSGEIPSVFLLQPMKNTEKLRRFLVERGCRITRDDTFEDGRFYDFIAGENAGGDEYGEREFRYGRDNLKNPAPAFYRFLASEIRKIKDYLSGNPSRKEREKLLKKLQEREEIISEIIGNLP